MQDQKTQLVEKLQEYEKNKNDTNKSGDDILNRIKELEAENAKLRESSAGPAGASREALAEMEEKHKSQI